MATKTLISLSLLLTTITLLLPCSSSHNITRLLSNHPNFSSFNSLLTSTNLVDEINHRRTITILAVSNASITSLLDFSPDIQRHILSIHVILDYFDIEKLHNLNDHSTILTTLFQTFGKAEGLTGFLNVTKFAHGRVVFGSAASGAGLVADLVGPLASRPYNISVLEVSSIIVPPGIDGIRHNISSPPPPAAETPAVEPPVDNAEAPAADSPAADAPAAEGAPADAPIAGSPEIESPKGAEDEEVKSGAGGVAAGAIIGAIMGVVSFAWL